MPQTIRIDSDCKRANALFDTQYRRGTRNRVNPTITIKARTMRRGKERQKRGQFHGRKNAKLAHLIRDTHNCRGATQLFSQICAAYTTRTSRLSELGASPAWGWPGERAGGAGSRINPAGKAGGREKSSGRRVPCPCYKLGTPSLRRTRRWDRKD